MPLCVSAKFNENLIKKTPLKDHIVHCCNLTLSNDSIYETKNKNFFIIKNNFCKKKSFNLIVEEYLCNQP